jgi:pyruvate dehydrogenase E2 component (dihydrolipoamide acetyltransferase)
MANPVQMPQPGNTVEECVLVRWIRKRGERVSAGDIIAEIETDKANFDIEAPIDGLLLDTFFDEGALVPVFTNIGVIGEEGEEYEGLRPKLAAGPVSLVDRTLEQPALAGERRGERAGSLDAASAPVLSPRARRFAEEHDFLPSQVSGSGPGGRVLEADLRNLYDRSPRVSALARDLTVPPVPLSGIRNTIAKRMRESLSTTAQYTLHSSADATGLLALRARIKAEGDRGADVNINDLVMYCTIRTLEQISDLNAELIDGEIYRRPEIHLAFACDTPRGLVVPVLKDSQKLKLEELAARVRALTEQAVNGTLNPDDMTGGTFTISNLGSLGIEAFTPVLNPPQVAILGVNAIQLKPVRRDGAVVFVEHIGLSLTCDHQVIDGAPGARFLQALRRNIENVEALAGPAAP